ncbi:hypothetical protein BH10BAC6_BH10BAC6_06420 [soil metagenome]
MSSATELVPNIPTFGAHRIGSKVQRTIKIDVRVPGGPDFSVKKPSGLNHPYRVEDGKGPNGMYPVVDGQFVELTVTFHPTADGEFRDTLILERPAIGNRVDKIIAIFSGIGSRVSIKVVPVDFTLEDSNIYIGDSIGIQRRVLLDKDDAHRFRQMKATNLGPPFRLIISPETDTQGGEIILGASFEPRIPGVFRDTLAFERIDTIPGVAETVVLDTIVYMFFGIAKQQQGKIDLAFNAFVGDAPMEKSGSFRVESSNPYTYTGSALTNGPCDSIRVVNSSVKPEEDRVDYTVRCVPIRIGSFVDTLVIKRFNAKREVVDQTLIVCTTTVRPRPLTLTLAFTPEVSTAKIGDTVTFAVIATANHVPDEPARVKSATFTFAYNATVLIPLPSSTVTTDRRGDTSTVTITRAQSEELRLVTGVDTLGVLRCVVALGNAERDVVQPLISVLEAEQTAQTSYQLNAATITVSDIWEHAGGPRLVNSLRGPCDISVDPTPMRTTSTMKLTNVPTDVGTLHIVRSSGVVVADLTADVRAGVREFVLTAGTGSGIALSPGTYYARLLVGSNGKTVYSVVRMIVVE